jgi:hypothetical protein
MSDKGEFRHSVCFNDEGKKLYEKIAALLDFESWNKAIDYSCKLAERSAVEYVKGNTKAVFITPELELCLKTHPKFFEALCQEGVVEWLEPFVLGKVAQGPLTNQHFPDRIKK